MKKRIVSILLAVVMIVGIIPLGAITAFAEETTGGTEKYIVRGWDDTEKKVTEKEEDIPTGAIPITSETTTLAEGGWYVVSSDVTVWGQIKVNGTENSPTNLILMDGCKLTASSGIALPQGKSLNIYGQSDNTGTVEATGSESCAGIGGGNGGNGGTVTVHGGTVNATGDFNAAGIGGGDKGNGGDITVYGGTVNATGGTLGAGIGSGNKGPDDSNIGGTLTVYGGTVTASGGYQGAGIGGGTESDGGNVTVHGGTVNATGNGGGAGIGGGIVGDGGTITVYNGIVNATGDFDDSGIGGGAGIGGGRKGNGGIVKIYGGIVTAVSNPDIIATIKKAEGIGHGADVSESGSLELGDSAVIEAGNDENDAEEVPEYKGEEYVRIHWHNFIDGECFCGKSTNYIVRGWNGENVTETKKPIPEDAIKLESSETEITLSAGAWYVVFGEVTIPKITVEGTPDHPTSLILTDGCTLNVDDGIIVEADNALNIYGQKADSGTVNAKGGEYNAGIGSTARVYGGAKHACGTVVIHGGTVNATGGVTVGSAGIGGGGGYDNDGGTVIIYGGNVNAYGNGGGAGIGGGPFGNGGDVYIYGGAVTADIYKEYGGAGIGAGGGGKTPGTLTLGPSAVIKEGNNADEAQDVTAYSGKYYVQIHFHNTKTCVSTGYKHHQCSFCCENEPHNFENGKCTACGMELPEDCDKYIKRSLDEETNTVVSSNAAIPSDAIEVEGSDSGITLTSHWYLVSENAIVSNITVDGTANIILMDGCTLTVEKGIVILDGCVLNIYGQKADTGNLTVTANSFSNGIGGISLSQRGTFVVYGGTVEATGDGVGSGIACHTTVYGGTVTGTGGRGGVGIGDNVTVYGGTVNAIKGIMGDVTVYGGTVTASCELETCAIDGSVTVYGGTLTAICDKGCAISVAVDFTVNGGTVYASGKTAVDGDVTVKGGYIEAEGKSHGINGSVTVNGGEVNVSGDNGINGSATVYSGKVTASGAYAVSGYLTVVDGDVFCNGRNAVYGYTVVNGGTVTVEATNNAFYGDVTVNGGTVVADGAASGISGELIVYDGTVSVNASAGSGVKGDLTVDGGIVNVKGESIGVEGDANIVEGFVTIIGGNKSIGKILNISSFNAIIAGSGREDAELVDNYENQKYVEVHYHSSDIIKNIGTTQHECLYCGKLEDHYFVNNVCRCGEIETLTVTFDLQGHGTSVEDQFIKAFTKVQRPTEPTDESYVFDGWFTEPECKTPWDFDTVTITQDTVIYAKWVIGSCDVRFILSGGKGGAASTVTHFSKVPESIDVPTRDGLSFYGYYDFDGVKYFDANGNGVKVWDKETAEDVLIAYWVEASTHVHSFSPDWAFDDIHHWHNATCGCKEDVVSGFGEHTFGEGVVNGNITTYTCVCGYTKVVYDKPDDEGEIISGTTYTGISLTLGSDISINFYMELSDDARNNGTMTFNIGGRIVTGIKARKNENGYYFSTPLTALEMAETVTATFTYNGIDYVQEYSVAEYIDTIVGNPDKYGKEAVALAKKIANYGYYAQVYLASIHSNVTIGKDGYEEMDKFDGVDIDVAKAIEALANYKVTVSGTSDNLSLYGSTVYFDSATALNYYVTVKNGVKPTATAVNKVIGKEKDVEIKLYKDNIYIVSVKDITATELADDIEVVINNEITLTGSVFAYCNSVVMAHSFEAATEKDTFAVNAMAAFYEYYEAACDYANRKIFKDGYLYFTCDAPDVKKVSMSLYGIDDKIELTDIGDGIYSDDGYLFDKIGYANGRVTFTVIGESSMTNMPYLDVSFDEADCAPMIVKITGFTDENYACEIKKLK